MKNKSKNKEKYAKKQLSWIAYIGGKRESRRLLGDIILSEHDLPRGVYKNYLPDLQNLMSKGIGKPGFPEADTQNTTGIGRSKKSFN